MNEQPEATLTVGPRQGRIAQNFILLGGGQVISSVIGVLVTAVVARTLGPADYGMWFLIGTIAGAAGVVADWGQSTLVIREIARGRLDRAPVLGSAAMLRTVTTLIAAAIGFAFAFVSGYSTLVVVLAGFAVIAAYPLGFVSLLGAALRGIDRTDVEVLAQLLGKFLVAIAIVVALYFGGGLASLILAPGIAGAIALYFALRMFWGAGLRMARPVAATVRELSFAGAPLVVASLTVAAHGLVDVTLLALLTTPVVVGWLGAARTFIGILITPATILAMASFPEISRVSSSHDALKKVVSASARLLLAVGGLSACGVFALALPAVQLVYGPKHFDPAAVVLQVCAPFFPLFFINFLMGNTAIAIGKSNHIAAAKAVSVTLSALLSWFLIPHFQASVGNGAVGLIISYCVSEVLMTVAFVRMLPRGLIGRDTLGHAVRACLAAAVVAYLGVQLAPMVTFWIALAAIPALFALVALAIGLLKMSDIDKVLGMAHSVFGRLAKFVR